VIHVFQLRKRISSNSVQAGLALVLATVLSACSSEQPAPVEVDAARVAATVGGEHEQADLPEVTITASRTVVKNEG
jgi:hypothetical protein